MQDQSAATGGTASCLDELKDVDMNYARSKVRSKASSTRTVLQRTVVCMFVLLTLFSFAATLQHARAVQAETRLQYSRRHSVVIFFAPKPGFEEVPGNLIVWREELQRIAGGVVLFLNAPSDVKKAEMLNFRTERVQESNNGFPLLSSVLNTISGYSESGAVGFGNSDLLPDENFARNVASVSRLDFTKVTPHIIDSQLRAYAVAERHEKAWLIILSRVDYDLHHSDGKVHMDGGVDFWIWNNLKRNNNIFGLSATIPAFRIARPWFDNWLTSTALQAGGRHVIDGTAVLKIYHRKHSRMGDMKRWDDPQNRAKLKNDADWLQNAELSNIKIRTSSGSLSTYHLGIGTACEALLFLSTKSSNNTILQIQRRAKSVPCPSCTDCYSEEVHHSPVVLSEQI